ncbi:GGDEF domain-containing protein, partial [Pseudoalteromonas ruthenica]
HAQGFLLARPAHQPPVILDAAQVMQLKLRPQGEYSEMTMSVGLLAQIESAIDQATRCKDAHKRFEQNKLLMSLAVIDAQQQPVGLLHRDQLTEVFAAPYGHA